MKQDIFSVPFYQYEVKDWNEKKSKLLQLFQKTNVSLLGNVLVTKHNLEASVFADEIGQFKNDSGIEVICSAFWFQKYHRGMNHDVHNHGIHGFSSVCFIEYDEIEHKPPCFVSPFLDVCVETSRSYIPKVKEGDIIFFPSNLMHYVPVNNSNKERLVVSFNLKRVEKTKYDLTLRKKYC